MPFRARDPVVAIAAVVLTVLLAGADGGAEAHASLEEEHNVHAAARGHNHAGTQAIK